MDGDHLFNRPRVTTSQGPSQGNPVPAEEGKDMTVPGLQVGGSQIERGVGIIAERVRPGLKKDELKVSLTDGVLAVKGRKRLFRDGAETSVDIERSLLVPEDVDPERIQARYVDGILTLEISKREEAKPKTIEVRVA